MDNSRGLFDLLSLETDYEKRVSSCCEWSVEEHREKDECAMCKSCKEWSKVMIWKDDRYVDIHGKEMDL